MQQVDSPVIVETIFGNINYMTKLAHLRFFCKTTKLYQVTQKYILEIIQKANFISAMQ